MKANPFYRSLLVLLALLFALTSALAREKSVPSADLRLLIDVSGSMKKNDPLNLRVPALKLLVNLLPPDAQASLWLFADEAELLQPLEQTSENWKRRAFASAQQIHSRGQYTDIEAALIKATGDWNKAERLEGKRSVVILTDGMVDISKDARKNAESRRRILGDLLPRLQQLGIQVHSIALSEQSDLELLRQLSQSTGGWHETLQTAEQLQRMFAKVANKTTPQDSVPLQGNRFTIDPAIQEFTLLAFLGQGAEATKLIAPDRTEISELMQQPNVRWHHEQGYDLITVQSPQPGEWRLVAKTDPDNQVTVITDLKLVVKDLPNYLPRDEALDINASFTEKNGVITKDAFLDLITLRVNHAAESTPPESLDVARDPTRKGYFTAVLKDLPLGKHTLVAQANGKTFQREITQSVEIIERLVATQIKADTDATPPGFSVTLKPNAELLDINSVQIVARLSSTAGPSVDKPLAAAGGVWTLQMPLPSPQELLTLNFSVSAKTREGRDIQPNVAPIVLNTQTLQQLLAPPPPPPPAEPHHAEEKPHEPAHAEEKPAEEHPAEETDWLMVGVIALGINLALGAGGFFIYRWYKKRTEAKRAALLNEIAP
jgi:uncharacterized protein (TIGR03503 family)